MRLSGFNLNQLMCLQALLQERSVTMAARHVNLSQSAVSAILAQLRQHFGDELLIKSGRTLITTPFAESLITPLASLLLEAKQFAAQRPVQDLTTTKRDLRIAGSDAVFEMCLAEAIQRASDEMPGLRFDVLPLSENTGRLLRDGHIDLVIAGQLQGQWKGPRRLMFEDQMVCIGCCRCGPSAGEVSPDTIANFEHVVVRYDDGKQAASEEEFILEIAIKRRPTYVWSYMLVPHLISGSKRLAIVPKRIALKYLERWDFQLFNYPSEALKVPAYAFWHPSRNSDMVLERFIEMVV